MAIVTSAQDVVNRMLAPIGARMIRDRPMRDAPRLFALKAQESGVQTILDIGANTGQFGHWIRNAGWTKSIVSFEPVGEAHRQLLADTANDADWTVAPRMALGSENGNTTINVSIGTQSSSLLDVTESSTRVAPQSAFSAAEAVRVARLDDVDDVTMAGPYAIKLDTQGFEIEVLRGAAKTLANTAVIMAEISLAPLYRGGATVGGVFDLLEHAGFRAIAVTEGFVDYARNEMLQVDAVFVKT